jgi:hypothetical protein
MKKEEIQGSLDEGYLFDTSTTKVLRISKTTLERILQLPQSQQ